jgi:ribosomal protein L11 methyltransferase
VGGGGAHVIRLGVRVPRERAELVAAELLALSPGGLEEVDLEDGLVELAIYGAPGEVADLGPLRAVVGDALVDVVTTEVPDDWSERWRDWHRPLDVGSLRVRPPWEPARAGALDVVIDPGQAFGTGAHPTTRLSLELLCELPARGPLADWGCGSGVLALAAARLGFDPVLACDHDPASVEATLAAAETNGIAAHVAEVAPRASAGDTRASGGDASVVVSRCDLRRAPGPWAPTVTANLVRPLLLEVAALMDRPPERLIVSGLETGEPDAVVAAFARHGLREAARREGDGWSAILLTR